MALLIVGIAVFLGIHVVPTLPQLREGLIGRLGETGYKIFFSLLSTLGFVLLVYGFARAPVIQIWSPPEWTRWVALVLTLPAFILIVASYVPGQIKAKLRHPFLAGIKFWRSATSSPMAILLPLSCSPRFWPMPSMTGLRPSGARSGVS